jgi:hypothetical protein
LLSLSLLIRLTLLSHVHSPLKDGSTITPEDGATSERTGRPSRILPRACV